MVTSNDLAVELNDLSARDLEAVQQFVRFLKWRDAQPPAAAALAPWSFDFLEQFATADQSADRDRAGMEIRVGEAVCGNLKRAALWEHPPLVGAAHVAYVVPVPPNRRNLMLRFSIGIRDGAELPSDRLVAFRILVNGWKMWSAVKNSHDWDEYQVRMPEVSSNVARVEFVTDGLGDHRWNWAVWGEPKLVADS